MALSVQPPAEAKRLHDFLIQAGYTEENLRTKLGFSNPGFDRLRNLARLQDLTQLPICINTLLRWFWIGTSQDVSSARHVPVWFTPLALECGLLSQNKRELVPEVLLMPTEGLILAADLPARFESADPEFVLWTNPTSQMLSHLTVRRPSRATLDLGTGNGIQALRAAAHSDKVVATDLNPRALAFAAFNARLNGIGNIEFLAGDGFEPVRGRTFDLIVSNPPYYITPSTRYLFCDNPRDLDQLCRALVREAAAYLNEDGYFQMLCEWAEVHGQRWQEKLKEWLATTGCDAWVIKHSQRDPSQYAEERIRQTTPAMTHDAEQYATYMAYYRERNVRSIHGGIIVMRRRAGRNWMVLDEISQIPKASFGDAVLRIFAARDFLQANASDDELARTMVRLSPDARLEHVSRQLERAWKRDSLTLRLVKGFEFFVDVQPVLADFLAACDGTQMLDDVIAEFAAKVKTPLPELRSECLKVVRQLIERGFLVC